MPLSSHPLPFLHTEGNYFFKLVGDSIPANRAVVQLLDATGESLGASFVFQLVEPDPEPNVRLNGTRKPFRVEEKTIAPVRLQFCQYVMTYLAMIDSPYRTAVKNFNVSFAGKNLSGIGSVRWLDGNVSMDAVQLRT